MLRVLNLVSIILYAVDGLFVIAIRFFADHPAGYSMELFAVDLTVACSVAAALGFLALYKQRKFGLTVILIATAGHLILGPFTDRSLYAPIYVVLVIIGWFVYRQIGKPVPATKK
jgi:hypothetical protein